MGSPLHARFYRADQAQHEVELTRDFLMGAHEVTVGQFRAFAEATRYQTDAEKRKDRTTWRLPGFNQGDDQPVVCVSWDDAAAFCRWLSEKEGFVYRLPTEAEWEYACRAGTTTAHGGGDDLEDLARLGNGPDAALKRHFADWPHTTLAADDGHVFPAPVGKYRPNAFGLYDMHGNAWEWCQDWYADYPTEPQVNPTGPEGGERKVVRGGCWSDAHPLNLLSAHRANDPPESAHAGKGFRVVRVLPDR